MALRNDFLSMAVISSYSNLSTCIADADLIVSSEAPITLLPKHGRLDAMLYLLDKVSMCIIMTKPF